MENSTFEKEKHRNCMSDNFGMSESGDLGGQSYLSPPPYDETENIAVDMTSHRLPNGNGEHVVHFSEVGVELAPSSRKPVQSPSNTRRSIKRRLKTALTGVNWVLHFLWLGAFAFILIWYFTKAGTRGDPSEYLRVLRNITKEDINVITDGIDGLRADVNRMSNDVTSLSNDVKDMKNKFSGDINGIKNRLQAIEQAKEDSESTSGQIRSRLSQLESLVATIRATLSKNEAANLKSGWSTVLAVVIGLMLI